MVAELGVFVIFPSNESMIRCRPLLGRVPRVGSPASTLLPRHSDFPAPPLRSLSLRSAVPRPCDEEASGSLRFLGSPPVHALLSSDPGETVVPGHSGVALLIGTAVLPSTITNASAPTTTRFRGSFARPARSLSTLRSHGYPCTSLRPRKTRFRLVAHLGRAGFEPAGFHCKVSALICYVIAFSSPRLCLTHCDFRPS